MRRATILRLALTLSGLALPVTLTAQDSLALAGLRWREVGPFRGGRSVAVSGNPSRDRRVLDGHHRRRRLQVDQRRPVVGARHRQVLRRHDRRHRRRGVGARRRLRRRRRVSDPRQRLARRRRLEDHRRRQDVDVRRSRRHAADRRRRRASDQPRPRLRRARSATSGRRIRSAASIARRTAARSGRRFSSGTIRPASSIS